MSMICPQCQGVFEQQTQCRECGCRLSFHEPNLLSDSGPDRESLNQWQHSVWGKIFIGLLLAQGLSYGLEQLLAAGWIAANDEAGQAVWKPVLLHGLQALSIIAGGAITGAGQSRGLLYGFVVGLLNGICTLFIRQRHEEGWGDIVTFTQPILHMGAGMIGGLLGMLIWKPTPELSAFQPPEGAVKEPVEPGWTLLFSGPVHYARVSVGIVGVVMGVLWSQAILGFVLRASQGTLTISSNLQAQLVGWEIAALATLFAAGLAGAATWNGLKQGLCVGVGSCVCIVGVHLASPRMSAETFLVVEVCVLILSIAGGWFGGQLFPPIGRGKRRRFSSY